MSQKVPNGQPRIAYLHARTHTDSVPVPSGKHVFFKGQRLGLEFILNGSRYHFQTTA